MKDIKKIEDTARNIAHCARAIQSKFAEEEMVKEKMFDLFEQLEELITSL